MVSRFLSSRRLTCLATRPAAVGWLIIFSAKQSAVEYDNLFVKLEEVHMWKRKRWNELSICQKVVIALLSALQFIMLAAALWDIRQRSDDEIQGSKVMWTLVSFVNFIGPIAYFLFGRKRTEIILL